MITQKEAQLNLIKEEIEMTKNKLDTLDKSLYEINQKNTYIKNEIELQNKINERLHLIFDRVNNSINK